MMAQADDFRTPRSVESPMSEAVFCVFIRVTLGISSPDKMRFLVVIRFLSIRSKPSPFRSEASLKLTETDPDN